MALSRWKIMAGMLSVSLGGLATVAGQQCQKSAEKAVKGPTEQFVSADPPGLEAPAAKPAAAPMGPDAKSPAPPPSLDFSTIKMPPAPPSLQPPTVKLPTPASGLPGTPTPAAGLPGTPVLAPMEPQAPTPLVAPAGLTADPLATGLLPPKPASPATPAAPAATGLPPSTPAPAAPPFAKPDASPAPAFPPVPPGSTTQLPPVPGFGPQGLVTPPAAAPAAPAAGTTTPPASPPVGVLEPPVSAKTGEDHHAKPAVPATPVVPSSGTAPAYGSAQHGDGALIGGTNGATLPSTTSQAASVVPASASASAAKLRIVLRVGEGEPTFEVRSGDDLLMKVICEKVDVASPEKGTGLSSVKAHGKVHFAGFGAEGTCDELSFLAGTGEVTMTGNVKIQVKDKLGRVESELSTENVKYRIDASSISGILKP